MGGERAVFEKHLHVLQAIGDQPLYIGPIGAGTVAKLAHNCASFAIQAALAEIFTLGVKGGVEPLALFRALRQGASGRKRTFDRLADYYLPGRYEPASFALKLAHKDVTLALELAEKLGVPMRIGRIAHEELAEAMRRGWGERDCRAAMMLQEERAGVAARVSPERLPDALKDWIQPGKRPVLASSQLPGGEVSAPASIFWRLALRTAPTCLSTTASFGRKDCSFGRSISSRRSAISSV